MAAQDNSWIKEQASGVPILSSEERCFRANRNVYQEILIVCRLIEEIGTPHPRGGLVVPFGKVFQYYTVSANLVGILIRARKYGVLHFEGECLLVGAHDHTPIHMPMPYRYIDENFRWPL